MRPAAGSRRRPRRRPRWRWPRSSPAASRRPGRACGTGSAPRWPRPPPRPARPRPCRPSRSGCRRRRARPPMPAISRMAACSEAKSPSNGVDGDHGCHAVAADDRQVGQEVGRAELHLLRVLLEHGRRQRAAGHHPVPARVQLHRPHRRHHDGGVGHEARGAALDVEEALRSHVGAEARLGDEVLAGVDPDQVGHHRRVAVGDVAEGTGVDEDGGVLEGLQQVRLDGVAHDHRHGAGGPAAARRSPARRPRCSRPRSAPCARAGRAGRARGRAPPSPPRPR